MLAPVVLLTDVKIRGSWGLPPAFPGGVLICVMTHDVVTPYYYV